ncbi:MAG: cyclic nucleotide-binding domain-containing protein [Atopobiaceae bacterium]|nr:cyclic nucleotide-binding domain-containing protein [Atopobiaceae bacterium]
MIEEKYRKGQVVFRQGDPGDCLYYIRWGSVGVYVNYGAKNQEKLAELRAGDYFGEMGLIDNERRSATVISLDYDTVLNRISEQEFDEFLNENPARIVDILKRLSHKLRDTTKSYLEICKAVGESVGTQATEVDESKTYGFDENEKLRTIHDGVSMPADNEA